MNTTAIRFYNICVALCLALCFPQGALCQVKPEHIKYETDPHYIWANQPFQLVFTAYGSNTLAINNPSEIDTTNFNIIDGPVYNDSVTNVNGKFLSSVIYTYTLVPVTSGSFSISPFSFSSWGKPYLSDTIKIHVYDGRLTPEDSLKRLNEFKRRQSRPSEEKDRSEAKDLFFDQFFNKGHPLTTSAADIPKPGVSGIQFSHADTVYTGKVDQAIHIDYSLSFTNIGGMTYDKLYHAGVQKYNCPKGLTQISTHTYTKTSVYYADGIVSTVFTKIFTLTVKADKKGKYTIPPVIALYNGKKYFSHKARVEIK